MFKCYYIGTIASYNTSLAGALILQRNSLQANCVNKDRNAGIECTAGYASSINKITMIKIYTILFAKCCSTNSQSVKLSFTTIFLRLW